MKLKTRSILIDTNLFLLLIIGLYKKELIGKHKRTKSFTAEDFDLLVKYIKPYKRLWVTAHCLAEISNLLPQTNEYHAQKLMRIFSKIVTRFKESYIPKKLIFDNDTLERLGVADTSIVIKSKRVSCVITTDLDLYLELKKSAKTKVENFNHLRKKILIRSTSYRPTP